MEQEITVIVVRATGIPWYRREDWDALKRILEDSDKLHDSFDDWRKAAGGLENHLRSQGHVVERAYIDPDTFPDWCRSRGLNVDAHARTEFANSVAFAKHGKTN